MVFPEFINIPFLQMFEFRLLTFSNQKNAIMPYKLNVIKVFAIFLLNVWTVVIFTGK